MYDCSIIIINYKTKLITKRCIDSILNNKWKFSYKIILVDNHSNDGSVEFFKKVFPKVTLIESNENLGFSGGNNLGLKQSEAKFHLFLNSDTEVLPDSLDNLLQFAIDNQERFGIVSCKLLNPDKSLQPNAGSLPTTFPLFTWISGIDDIFRKLGIYLPSYHQLDESYYKEERQVGWVSGTAFMVSDKLVKKIGGWDENIFMYAEDAEYCLRAAKSGFGVGFTSQAEIIHIGGASSADPKYRQWLGEFRGLLYVYKKHFGLLSAIGMRFLFYFFILLRVVAFSLTGRVDYSKTYAKILISI